MPNSRQKNFDVGFLAELRSRNVFVLWVRPNAKPRRRIMRFRTGNLSRRVWQLPDRV